MNTQEQALQTEQQQVLSFCQELPKELASCLQLQGLTNEELDHITASGHRSLADCFKLFDVVHQITTTHVAITRITQEVIQDFASDNVMYLELRTTPKRRPQHGISKRSYMSAVLAGLQGFRQEQPHADILVRFLLSIDRRDDTTAASETVELATELMSHGVVGIDLSGNPSVGHWDSWLPALQQARQAGLQVTLHAAEASRIPVELCLTSNVKTHSVPGYVDHHFRQFYAASHPVVLCTDDSTLFGTTLSQEYMIAATSFNLTRQQILDLAMRSIDYCFCAAEEKQCLRQKVQAFAAEHSIINNP